MYRIQKETGWTDDYLLWGVPWVSLRMKLLDEPHYAYGKSKKIKDEDELMKLLGNGRTRTGRHTIQGK